MRKKSKLTGVCFVICSFCLLLGIIFSGVMAENVPNIPTLQPANNTPFDNYVLQGVVFDHQTGKDVIRMKPDHAYYIELAGSASVGADQHGGRGAVLNLWFLNETENDIVWYFDVGDKNGGGKGGSGGNAQRYGNAGGGASFLRVYESDKPENHVQAGQLLMIAAGGGGAGGTPLYFGGNAGYGGIAPRLSASGGWVYPGTSGQGVHAGGGAGLDGGAAPTGGNLEGHAGGSFPNGYGGAGGNAGGGQNAYGGGGGGQGYSGGGGGSGGPSVQSGAGGGGGSSFVRNMFDTSGAKTYTSHAGQGYITVKEYYNPKTRVAISASDITFQFDGTRKDLPASVLDNTELNEFLHFYYTEQTTGNKYSSPYAPTNAGSYEVRISFDADHIDFGPDNPGYYAYPIYRTLTITPASMSERDVEIEIVPDPHRPFIYDGSPHTPALRVYDNSFEPRRLLTAGTDYIITSYTNNINAHTALDSSTVNIVGRGNYSGAFSESFKIHKAERTIEVVGLESGFVTETYNGFSHTPSAFVPNVTGGSSILSFAFARYSTLGTTVWDCPAPIDVGDYHVRISFRNDNYRADDRVVGLRITPRPINSPGIVVTAPAQDYTGQAVYAPPEDIVVFDGLTRLYRGVDFDVIEFTTADPNQINPGSNAEIRITGKGNYNDNNFSGRFTINKAAAVIRANNSTMTFGKLQPVTAIVTLPGDYADLGLGANLTFEYSGFCSVNGVYNPTNIPPTEAGEYTVKISLVSHSIYFAEDLTITLSILPISLKHNGVDVEISALIAPQVYDGSEQTPDVALFNDTLSEEMQEGIHFIILEYLDNVEAGIATVRIEGIGNYEETMEVRFRIERADLTVVPLPATRQFSTANPEFGFEFRRSDFFGDEDYINNFLNAFETSGGNIVFKSDADGNSIVGFYRIYADMDMDSTNAFFFGNYRFVFGEGELTVERYLVTPPTAKYSYFEYNGSPQTMAFNGWDDEIMGVVGDTDTATEVGFYATRITLKDPFNYAWGVEDENAVVVVVVVVVVEWSIRPAGLKTSSDEENWAGSGWFVPTISDVTFRPGLVLADVVIPRGIGDRADDGFWGWMWDDGSFALSGVGEYGNGNFNDRLYAVFVPKSDDYSIERRVLQFKVIPALVPRPVLMLSLSPDVPFTGLEYSVAFTGAEHSLIFDGLSLLMSVSGQRATDWGPHTARISLLDGGNYVWADTEDYDDILIQWTITNGTVRETELSIWGAGTFPFEYEVDGTTAKRRLITVVGTKDGDTVFFSTDRINWSDEHPDISERGRYSFYVMVRRPHYYDFLFADPVEILIIPINPSCPVHGDGLYNNIFPDDFHYILDPITFDPDRTLREVLFPNPGPLNYWVWDYPDTVPEVGLIYYYATYVNPDPIYAKVQKRIHLVVLPLLLTRPTAEETSFPFTGDEITLSILNFRPEFMTIKGNTGTEVGDYTAEITLDDTHNFGWDDDDADDISSEPILIGWRIRERTISGISLEGGGTFPYEPGTNHVITVIGTLPDDIVSFSLDGENWSPVHPEVIEKGGYRIYVRVQRTLYEDFIESTTIRINPVMPDDPIFTDPDYQEPDFSVPLVYDPDRTLGDVVLPPGWVWENPNAVPGAGDTGHYATYTSPDDNYQTVRKLIPVAIQPRVLAKPTAGTAVCIFTGDEITLGITGFDPALMRMSDVTATAPGSYKAYVSLIDTVNYRWADGTTNTLTFNWSIVETPPPFDPFWLIVSILLVLLAGECFFIFFIQKGKASSMNDESQNEKGGENL
jgi:hypothetical protein